MEYLPLLLALPKWVLCIIAAVVLIVIGMALEEQVSYGSGTPGGFWDKMAAVFILPGMALGGLGALVGVVKLFIWMVME